MRRVTDITVTLKAIGVSVLLLLSQGCSQKDATRSVGGRTFVVPQSYLLDSSIPWMPLEPKDGLIFTLNPSAPPKGQIIVLLQEYNQVCAGSKSSPYLRSMCGDLASYRFKDERLDSGIAKIRPDDDDIVSYYVYRNEPNRYIAVCADAAMPDDLGGMCAAIYSYKELKFTIRFREAAISELPRLAKSSVALLSSWERG